MLLTRMFYFWHLLVWSNGFSEIIAGYATCFTELPLIVKSLLHRSTANTSHNTSNHWFHVLSGGNPVTSPRSFPWGYSSDWPQVPSWGVPSSQARKLPSSKWECTPVPDRGYTNPRQWIPQHMGIPRPGQGLGYSQARIRLGYPQAKTRLGYPHCLSQDWCTLSGWVTLRQVASIVLLILTWRNDSWQILKMQRKESLFGFISHSYMFLYGNAPNWF